MTRHVQSRDDDVVLAAAMAVPTLATLEDGRAVAVRDWTVEVPCDGAVLVTITGYVRRDSVGQTKCDCGHDCERKKT